MDKLSKLRTIRDQLIESGMSLDEAVRHIADLLSREPLTVYTWLTESQRQPIPDNLLRLLKIILNSTHKS